ncbi:fibronectin type 3 and ankyrin repeat domains 1 protein-like [Mytilus trossulus]|uniref:fibronectin type 3 and ankyrin repeat domains 1 protein-like n=1 Tax=Mytilus trossulus TaxID=6551 RepID=UPI003006D958
MLILQYGRTPLMWAAWEGRLEVVTYLVTHGSQLEATSNSGGWTPLLLAALVRHMEVVTYLVTHGSQLEATTSSGLTALHYAAQYGEIDTTKWFVDQGCSPWMKTKEGKTPYDLVKIESYDNEERKRKKEEVMDFLMTVMLQTPEVYVVITLSVASPPDKSTLI